MPAGQWAKETPPAADGRRCLNGRTACAVFYDAAKRRGWTKRQRQTIFRLLLQRFGAILEKTTNGHHYQPRHLRRVTVETWLCCQGLISVPQNQMCDPFYQNFALTIELFAQLA